MRKGKGENMKKTGSTTVFLLCLLLPVSFYLGLISSNAQSSVKAEDMQASSDIVESEQLLSAESTETDVVTVESELEQSEDMTPPTAILIGNKTDRIELPFYSSLEEAENNFTTYMFEDSSNDAVSWSCTIRINSEEPLKVQRICGGISEVIEMQQTVSGYSLFYVERWDDTMFSISVEMENGDVWFTSVYTPSP